MTEKKKSVVQSIKDDQLNNAPQAFLEDLYENYYSRRREIYMMNLYRGVFFGFGSVVGGTIVVALLLWLLSALEFVPFVDGLVDGAQKSLEQRK
jgi:hypothetical protein